ncbi:MAG: TolC family protein [Gemmatimonadota bacterium]
MGRNGRARREGIGAGGGVGFRAALAGALMLGSAGFVFGQSAVAVSTRGPTAGSYSLERAVAYALEFNRELRLARLELDRAGQQVREARGSLFPEIEATLRYQRNVQVPEAFLPAVIFDPTAPPNELIPVRFGADNTWVARLSVTQPLFDAALFVGVGTAGRFRALQKETLRARAHRVASEVRRAYLDALLAAEQVRVTQNSVERVEKTLEETRALNRAGLASDYDVLRLEVQLANVKPSLRRNVNAVAEAGRVLAIRMGMDEGRAVGVTGELHQVDLSSAEANTGANRALLAFAGYARALEASFEELYATARRMRPEIRQVALEEDLERARLAFERSDLLPRLSAFFNYDLTAQENGSPSFFGENPNQRTATAQVGVKLELPIFAGLSRWSRVEQQKVRVRQAEVSRSELERRVENEVRTALEALEESRARGAAQRRAVRQASRGFEIVTAEYLAGTSSRLEVTDAELALRQAELNYAQAVYDYLAGQAAVDEAVGVIPVVDAARIAAEETRISRVLPGGDEGPDDGEGKAE